MMAINLFLKPSFIIVNIYSVTLQACNVKMSVLKHIMIQCKITIMLLCNVLKCVATNAK